jgi:hypothetical protein
VGTWPKLLGDAVNDVDNRLLIGPQAGVSKSTPSFIPEINLQT